MDKRKEEIVRLANLNPKLQEGELELDRDPQVSEGDDNGAYVQVWMWVPFQGTSLDKEAVSNG